MNDLTPDAFSELANSIADLNNISEVLAKQILASAGDAFENLDDDGRVTVTLPDGSSHRVIIPDDI